MNGTTIRRALALTVSAALLASLAVATTAAPAVAGKPKCGGQVATHVGTARGEVIRGTAKADVIVARGGHDIIYGRGGRDLICGNGGNDRIVGGAGNDFLLGKTGHDKLYGGAGRDLLVGGPGNDRLVGGPGNDGCLQGSGTGLRVACERPAVKVVLPPPPPPPPPEPKVLAIAYSDLDENDRFGPGDVMISKIVDSNGDGKVSEGDTIRMGRYPTKLPPTTTEDFADWGVTSHVIGKVHSADPDELDVWTGSGTVPDTIHVWYSDSTSSTDQYDSYIETSQSGGGYSDLEDTVAPGADDSIRFMPGSPSRPTIEVHDTEATSTGDDYFIDVDFFF